MLLILNSACTGTESKQSTSMWPRTPLARKITAVFWRKIRANEVDESSPAEKDWGILADEK